MKRAQPKPPGAKKRARPVALVALSVLLLAAVCVAALVLERTRRGGDNEMLLKAADRLLKAAEVLGNMLH